MSATSQRKTESRGSGDQPMEDLHPNSGDRPSTRMGPRGSGPVGFRDPGPETHEKGEPADEQSPKAIGIESEGGADAPTLGALTERDRGLGGGPRREDHLREAKPEDAERQRHAPDREIQPRLPETVRDDESDSGLGKGVAIPPGSVGRETGQTP